MNGLMRCTKARKQRQKYKRKKTRSKVCEYFFEFLLSVERLTLVFTCTVAVRIILSPIHSSSHAFSLLIFLLIGCSLHDDLIRAFPVTDVT